MLFIFCCVRSYLGFLVISTLCILLLSHTQRIMLKMTTIATIISKTIATAPIIYTRQSSDEGGIGVVIDGTTAGTVLVATESIIHVAGSIDETLTGVEAINKTTSIYSN